MQHPHSDVSEAIWGYEDGQASVQDVLKVVKSYSGPKAHYLWESNRYGKHLISFCFDCLSERKLFELLRVLIDDDPQAPLAREENCGYFLDVALSSARSSSKRNVPPTNWKASRRILLLLAVPGTTRAPGSSSYPLHEACRIRRIDPEVVNRLIDLDPDILMLPDNDSELPLHIALSKNPTSPFIPRMVETRPESLLFRNKWGQTPIIESLRSGSPSRQLATFLRNCVMQCPEAVAVTRPMINSALCSACRRFFRFPDLIDAIIQAHPAALCIAVHETSREGRWHYGSRRCLWDCDRRLPVAAAQRPTLAFVEEETLRMALIITEHAISDCLLANDDVVWFRQHMRTTVSALAPPAAKHPPNAQTGSAVVQSIRNNYGGTYLCRKIFQNRDVQRRLRDENDALFHFMSNPAVVGLYRLSRRDRSNPSATHQVDLLALVSNSLDCVYLQFREFAVHSLVQRRAGPPTTTTATTLDRRQVATSKTTSTPASRPAKRKREL